MADAIADGIQEKRLASIREDGDKGIEGDRVVLKDRAAVKLPEKNNEACEEDDRDKDRDELVLPGRQGCRALHDDGQLLEMLLRRRRIWGRRGVQLLGAGGVAVVMVVIGFGAVVHVEFVPLDRRRGPSDDVAIHVVLHL